MTDHPATTVSSPTVSVVMPAYNGSALIGETLASLQAQTFTDFEVIVVDDHSTDDTLAVVRAWPDPRIRVIQTPVNGGPVKARNLGVAQARGRYIAGLDHDDLCAPERLAAQVAWLDANPASPMVATNVAFLRGGVVSPSSYPVTTTPALIGWLLRIENPLAWSTVMIRGSAARALEPFSRHDRLYAEDFDLYHRLSKVGPIARLDAVLVDYRQHPGGVSKRFAERMQISATIVLADAHRPAMGDAAEAVADLFVTHLMMGQPVTDRATLSALATALGAAQATYLATHDCTAQDRALIARETAKRWARVQRTALRSGALGVRDIVTVPSPQPGAATIGLRALAVSGVVGGVRRARRRMGFA